MGSAQGSKWIIILLIYFAVLSTVVTIVTITGSGSYDSELNTDTPTQCNEPREIYEPYNIEPVSNTNDKKGIWGTSEYNRMLAHLDCTKSIGVVSETYCTNISGCSWATPDIGFWENFWGKLGLINTDPAENTCTGSMNLDNYSIDRFKTLFTDEWYVYPEDEARIYGDICSHSSVINDSELCEMVSCTWEDGTHKISNIEVEDISLSMGFFPTLWRSIKQMFTFTFDWGFDDYDLINYMLNFFTFWLPLIILALAIYQILPFT